MLNASALPGDEIAWTEPDAGAAVHAERKLWAAVLETAVNDARGEGFSVGRRSMDRADALAWFRSDARAVASFLWILSTLGLLGLAGQIRRRVGAMTRELEP